MWLRRYAKLVAACTVFLVYAGAMVTSTGSGLSVPDWPLSYGMVFPPMVGGIFYEHGHRMIAATVGLLTVILAFWLQRSEPKRFVRRLGWVAVGAVIIQGVLGGVTVLLLLPPTVSVAHAALAEIFLSINISIAFFTSRTYDQIRAEGAKSRGDLTMPAKVLVVVVFLQMFIGAVMRHLGAGLAIPDFPLSFGHLVPELTTTAITVNFCHRIGALAVLAALGLVGLKLMGRGEGRLNRLYGLIASLVVVQITLGAFTVWTKKAPIVTSLHVVNGASILAASVVFALLAHSLRPTARAREASSPTTEVTA